MLGVDQLTEQSQQPERHTAKDEWPLLTPGSTRAPTAARLTREILVSAHEGKTSSTSARNGIAWVVQATLRLHSTCRRGAHE